MITQYRRQSLIRGKRSGHQLVSLRLSAWPHYHSPVVILYFISLCYAFLHVSMVVMCFMFSKHGNRHDEFKFRHTSASYSVQKRCRQTHKLTYYVV